MIHSFKVRRQVPHHIGIFVDKIQQLHLKKSANTAASPREVSNCLITGSSLV